MATEAETERNLINALQNAGMTFVQAYEVQSAIAELVRAIIESEKSSDE